MHICSVPSREVVGIQLHNVASLLASFPGSFLVSVLSVAKKENLVSTVWACSQNLVISTVGWDMSGSLFLANTKSEKGPLSLIQGHLCNKSELRNGSCLYTSGEMAMRELYSRANPEQILS